MEAGHEPKSVVNDGETVLSIEEKCCICPFCPKSCVVVYRSRKMLQEHVRNESEHLNQIVPDEQNLEWVDAEKQMHKSRWRWVRKVDVLNSLVLSKFTMSGFRYMSKFEGTMRLLDKYQHFVEGHPGFEMRRIGKELKFFDDAVLFLKRVAKATDETRYKVRQFATRDHTGILKIAGFSCLNCEDSVRAYARSIARFIFYAINTATYGEHFEAACKQLQYSVDSNHSVSSNERCKAVDDILVEAMKQPQCVEGFSASMFINLFYVVAPNGPMNRTADFVRHAAVHMIYGLRGAYILKCLKEFDPQNDEMMSLNFLNEQVESAYSALQGLKRFAATCLEPLDCRIQWNDEGDVEVVTIRGNVKVSKSSMELMYKNLVARCHNIMQSIGFQNITQEMKLRCRDPNSKEAGEGIMSMNGAIFREYCEKYPGVTKNFEAVKASSVKTKKSFCGQIYSLGKTLVKALYLSGGPSARLTEISSWTVANTDNNHERNVRFLRGLIAIVNTYSKSGGAGIPRDKVACFADDELSSLVATYMIVVKHFECCIVQDIPEFGPEAQTNSRVCFLINKGKPVDGKNLGKIFQEEFISQNLDVTINDMRHVLESYARKEGCLLESVVPANPLLCYANHGLGTSNAVYGKGLGEDLPHIDADRMEQCWRYSQLWNRNVLGSSSSQKKDSSQNLASNKRQTGGEREFVQCCYCSCG